MDDRETLIRLHRSTLAALHKKREASTDDRERERLRKAIGDETRTITKLSGPGPGRPPKERIVVAPPKRRRKSSTRTVVEDLEYRLAELDRVAQQAELNGAWTAVVTAHKSAVDLRQQIELRRVPVVAEDPTLGMTDEEITAGIVDQVSGWDESTCDAVEEAIAARRGIRGSGLQVLAGGRSEGGAT